MSDCASRPKRLACPALSKGMAMKHGTKREAIAAMARAGKNYKQIAAELGIKPSSASATLTQLGLSPIRISIPVHIVEALHKQRPNADRNQLVVDILEAVADDELVKAVLG